MARRDVANLLSLVRAASGELTLRLDDFQSLVEKFNDVPPGKRDAVLCGVAGKRCSTLKGLFEALDSAMAADRAR